MTKEEIKKKYGFDVTQDCIDKLNKTKGYKELKNTSDITYKMGIKIAREQDQFIFDKVNECRGVLGYTLYLHKDELIRDLKKLDEYEKQKEVLNYLKENSNIECEGGFNIPFKICLKINLSEEDGDKYNKVKEWLEND